MADDIFRELQKFQDYMRNLQQFMSDINSLTPERAEGMDAQGAVRVRLGTKGLPESIDVASDWQRRQDPESIGQAVVEAYGSAMSDWMERWSRSLTDMGWERRAERVGDLRGALGSAPAASTYSGSGAAFGLPPAGMPERDLRHVVPRPLDQVMEDVLTGFDMLEGASEDSFAPPEVKGESAGRRVSITLSQHGLVSCEVDPQWAAQQTAVRLGKALDEALAQALTKAEQSESAGAAGLANLHLSGVMDEALAILNNPQRFLN
ncbi:hypothetical protein LRS74_08620 [Streptomyces sp. LX-29]|uniref:hypothetical protein n=1 Tax=Streptomyces sp. LX-29 TaxID=2900152 RepID=UPI00240DEF59|nr:hypothetical protein [Streptomyces sp. LX-29]WFB07107.1 hypothetical protein LRS74_08620 [Streptomyces sp. LX-29]